MRIDFLHPQKKKKFEFEIRAKKNSRTIFF